MGKRLHVKTVIISLYKCDFFFSVISEQAKREIPGAGSAIMQGFCAASEAFFFLAFFKKKLYWDGWWDNRSGFSGQVLAGYTGNDYL